MSTVDTKHKAHTPTAHCSMYDFFLAFVSTSCILLKFSFLCGCCFHFFSFESEDLWLTIKLIALLAVEIGERLHQRQTRAKKRKRKRNSLYRVQKSMKLASDRTSRKMVYHLVWIRFVYVSKWRNEKKNQWNSLYKFYQITLVCSRGHSQSTQTYTHTEYLLACSIFIPKANICLSITSAKDVCEITKCFSYIFATSLSFFFSVRISDEINHLK